MTAVRADRLAAKLEGAGVDVLLVTALVNVRYLTGYTGSNGLVLVGRESRLFVTDFRYVEQAAAEVDGSFERVQAPQELTEALAELLPGGAVRLGFEDTSVTVRQHDRLRELLPDRVELVPAGGLVERLRRVKDPAELELIAAASRIADEALEAVLAGGLAGRSERELALALDLAMRERGATGPSFDPIVAAGARGAMPHARPTDAIVQRGDVVVIDWGALAGGYCSDCTRTVAVGTIDDDARQAYELVLAAQLAGLEAVRPGAGGKAVDTIAREVIEAAGRGDQFGHGLGHGVGLDIHEAPRLAQYSKDTLLAGEIVTVEPGVYVPGRFGIRIEDLVSVSQEGGPRVLTGLSKTLQIVD
jgi:Xaa-Pro aminopeptidase